MTCCNKYLTNNNYDINNIDKYMENKYLFCTINKFKKNFKKIILIITTITMQKI